MLCKHPVMHRTTAAPHRMIWPRRSIMPRFEKRWFGPLEIFSRNEWYFTNSSQNLLCFIRLFPLSLFPSVSSRMCGLKGTNKGHSPDEQKFAGAADWQPRLGGIRVVGMLASSPKDAFSGVQELTCKSGQLHESQRWRGLAELEQITQIWRFGNGLFCQCVDVLSNKLKWITSLMHIWFSESWSYSSSATVPGLVCPCFAGYWPCFIERSGISF